MNNLYPRTAVISNRQTNYPDCGQPLKLALNTVKVYLRLFKLPLLRRRQYLRGTDRYTISMLPENHVNDVAQGDSAETGEDSASGEDASGHRINEPLRLWALMPVRAAP